MFPGPRTLQYITSHNIHVWAEQQTGECLAAAPARARAGILTLPPSRVNTH